MKNLFLSLIALVIFSTVSFAQHQLQTDDGAGHFYILQAPPVGGPGFMQLYTFPSSSGTLITQAAGSTILNGVTLNWPASNAAGVLTNNGSGVLSWAPASGSGTVTSVSVAVANGFSASVSNATTTPSLSISTTISGMLKGNGSAISAATAGTDYAVGTSALGTGILKSTTGTGALTIATAADFPNLNQNTTGSAASFTGSLSGDVSGTQGATSVDKIKGNTVPVNAAGVLTNNGAGVLTWAAAGGTGTVTSVSITSANGFSGSVATSTTTPAISISTTATGVLKGSGGSLVAATAGTDYAVGTSALGTGILKSTTGTGALTIATAADFPTLNQNTTGSAASLSGTLNTSAFPALTGDVTTTAGSLATTIASGAVTLGKMSNLAANSIIGNNTGAGATPIALSIAQVQTMLGTSGTNSGDVTLAGTPTYITIAGQVITRNAINLGTAANITGLLPALNGGTGINTSGATNGQILIGNGSGLSLATITAGTGITVTNGAGTISLATNGGTISGGTTNAIPKYTSATALGNSSITDNGTIVSMSENLSLTATNASVALKGNSTGTTTIQAGNQGATNLTYTLPVTAPTAGQVLSSTAGGTMSWVDQTGTTSGATLQSNPTNPTGTASTTGVMMGLAGSITLSKSGKLVIIVSATLNQSAGGNGGKMQIRYGTGTAPANAAALTGTATGNLAVGSPSDAAGANAASHFETIPMTCNTVLSLSSGTTYWIDLSVAALGGGTASLTDISITAFEL